MKSLIGTTALCLVGCAALQHHGSTTEPTSEAEPAAPVYVDAPMNNPAERDDPKAPIMRIAVFGSSTRPVAVPYFYGYPLYADGAALQGVRLMRQDNWSGYEREEHQDDNGVEQVSETFPSLGCIFHGVQEDEAHYVPFYVECDVPPPPDRGKNRDVVGDLASGAKADAVPKEPILAKAFLGDWHATTPGFDGEEGAGYFDTPNGLLGFGFVKGRLHRVAFLFDPAEKRWRMPEIWQPPAGVSITP